MVNIYIFGSNEIRDCDNVNYFYNLSVSEAMNIIDTIKDNVFYISNINVNNGLPYFKSVNGKIYKNENTGWKNISKATLKNIISNIS